MRVVREALEEGLDISSMVRSYDGTKLNEKEMEAVFHALRRKLDITEFMWIRNEKGYDPFILHTIIKCLLNGDDVAGVLLKKDDNSFLMKTKWNVFGEQALLGCLWIF